MNQLPARKLLDALLYFLLFILTFKQSTSIPERERSIHRYQYFPENERIKLRENARKMFYFGYDSYMKHAFPKDELNPIYCTGRGPDYENP